MIKKIFNKVYPMLPLKKHLFSVVKTVYPSIPKKIYQHLHFKDIITIKIDKEHSFKTHHYGYRIENDIFWKGLQGGFEKVSINLWIELCKNAEVIFDIGANTGIYALSAQAINPGATVFAYEAVKRVYDKLNENIRLNDFKIISSDCAVSNNDGQAFFYDTQGDHIYSVTVNKDMTLPGVKTVKVPVAIKKLSSIINEYGLKKIDVIKIDVETHEPELLEGMEQYLKLFKPAMLIEILEEDIAAKVQKLTEGMGYLYFNIDENKGARQVSKLSKLDHFNFLLCNEATAKKLNLI